MSSSIYQASVPVFAAALTNMQAWIDKAVAEGKDEKALVEARLTPDMRPFSGQIQMSSDTAKSAVARLAGIEAPSMPDTETSFTELKARCQRTIDFIRGVDAGAFDNFKETWPIFLALALGLAVTGRSGGVAATGAWIWLGARTAYLPLYLIGIPYLRTVCFGVAAVGLVMMATRLF